MIKRVIGQLLPRQRYMGGTVPRSYFPAHRERLMKELGGASKIVIHARVYDRAGVGTPSIDFDYTMGSFGDEYPANALRTFTATKSGDVPTLPWNPTNMTTLPDDGTFVLTPSMGLLDIAMKVSGSASTWVEAEVWYTAEYAG